MHTSAQIDEGSVFGLPTGTLGRNHIYYQRHKQGAIAFATDTNKIYKFDGTSWNGGRPTGTNSNRVYFGAFTITSLGNQSVSGLPFQPSQISFVRTHANVESLEFKF